MADPLYTNGVIAVKEMSLFGEKLLRFAEMTAEEVLRALRESGFGGSEEDEEGMLLHEERALDGFIRTYAPSDAERAYLLSPRDFHNAKALVKAEKLDISPEKMLAPAGEITIEALSKAVSERNFSGFGELGAATEAALGGEMTGAELGAVFEKALFRHLKKACSHSRLLKKLLAGKADRTNLLTAMRAPSAEAAEPLYVEGGVLAPKALDEVFSEDGSKKTIEKYGYGAFYELLRSEKEARKPFTQGERVLGSFEADFFRERRYELQGKEPFLYYVFRRRAEIADLRILLVCLRAGLPEQEIKKRLRAV